MSIAKPRRIGGIIGSVPRTTSGVYGLTKLSEVNFPFAIGGDTYTYAQDGKYWRCHMFSQVGSDTLTFLRGGLVEYLVVGGGGGGGTARGGGGGAGGLRAAGGFSVASGARYAILVGGGGDAGSDGSSSSAFAIQALGGGRGGANGSAGAAGGSGGGGGGYWQSSGGAGAGFAGGSGQAGQGFSGGVGSGAGGASWGSTGGGGGGAGEVGQNSPSGVAAGAGGDGLQSPLSGQQRYYAGGGAGGVEGVNAGVDRPAADGGLGGGGKGAGGAFANAAAATAGDAFTGGGGGGGAFGSGGAAAGGSGIVIVRYQITKAEFEGDEPYYDDVSLLLHMNGANGSTTFTDSSKHRHAVTANGNAQISTAQSKFGGASAAFDGTGDYLTVANDASLQLASSGAWTLEFWFYANALATQQHLLHRYLVTSPFNGFGFAFGSGGAATTTLRFWDGATWRDIETSVATGQWRHVAVSYEGAGTTARMFLDGVQKGAAFTPSASIANTANNLGIGAQYDGSLPFNGYIDDLRITKGVARYTSNFTPPQRELLPDILAGITPSGLLDQYTGAAAAYSLRSLSDAYTGPVVTVRRSSDSAEADFTATEVSDGTLEAWCGAGDGLVKTVYDQSGHGRHASQSTATAQPKIVSGGVLVLENGLPAIEFDGTNDYLSIGTVGISGQQPRSFFWCANETGGITYGQGSDAAGANWELYAGVLSRQLAVSFQNTNWSSSAYAQKVVANLYTGGAITNASMYEDGVRLAGTGTNGTATINTSDSNANIGYEGRGAPVYLVGTLQELIIYPVDQSANRVAIEDNINSHYNVFDPTVLLLHMDGTNGSTTFTDSSLNNFTVTANGDAQISTAQSKFGGASAAFDGTGDYLSVPADNSFVFGTGDFCIEFFSYVSADTNAVFYDFRSSSSGSGASTAFNIGRVDSAGYYVFNNVAGIIMQSGSGTAPLGQWVHLAVCRDGTAMRMFVDGVQVDSASVATDFSNTQPPTIGTDFAHTNNPLNGYIDDLRITKGRALYTANFTPPTQAHPDPVPYDQDAINYIAAVEAQDGEQLESGVRMAINDFFVGLKDDGIFPAIKSAALLCGARTLAGALVPLVGAAPTNYNFVEATDYDRATGLKSDGSTKYLDSNRAGNADPQNDHHISCYLSGQTSKAGVYISNRNISVTSGYKGIATNFSSTFLNSASATQASRSGLHAGLLAVSRASSSTFSSRLSGTTYTETISSIALSSANILVFNRQNTSAPVDARLAFYSIGESLDLALLDARVSALVTAIGNLV